MLMSAQVEDYGGFTQGTGHPHIYTNSRNLKTFLNLMWNQTLAATSYPYICPLCLYESSCSMPLVKMLLTQQADTILSNWKIK